MDAVSAAATANAIQAVNDVLIAASKETIDAAAKMVKVAAEMKIGPGSGNGNTIDLYA
jgi:hypothetical protein